MTAGALAPGSAVAPSSITRQQLPAGHGGAVAELDFLEHAGRGRRHLENDLVGLQIDEIFIARHGIAGLLVPRDNAWRQPPIPAAAARELRLS